MIYVLLLEQDKIYVGYSARPVGARFLEHFDNQGSKWTMKYKPLQVLEIREGGLPEEDLFTLEMMRIYGWYNVRGGRWCNVEMTRCPDALLQFQGLTLPKKLGQSTQSKCNCGRCGRNTHTIDNCYAKTHLNGSSLTVICQRCGRNNHNQEFCYAKTKIDGTSIFSPFDIVIGFFEGLGVI